MNHRPTLHWLENVFDKVVYANGTKTFVKGTGAGFCTNCGYDIQVLEDQSAKNIICELCNQPTVFGCASLLCMNDEKPTQE